MVERMVTARVDAPPAQVFATLTDLTRLPSWNAAISRVAYAPLALEEGAEWIVELHVLGRTWLSRSRVLTLDPGTRTFAYRSQTDDDNPSYAEWCWSVTAQADGSSLVSVTYDLHPLTFWRKHVLAPLRRSQLGVSELPRSLVALAAVSKAPVA